MIARRCNNMNRSSHFLPDDIGCFAQMRYMFHDSIILFDAMVLADEEFRTPHVCGSSLPRTQGLKGMTNPPVSSVALSFYHILLSHRNGLFTSSISVSFARYPLVDRPGTPDCPQDRHQYKKPPPFPRRGSHAARHASNYTFNHPFWIAVTTASVRLLTSSFFSKFST